MSDINLVLLPNPVLGDPTMYPNLGLLYLGAVLQRDGYSVNMVDLRDRTAISGAMIPSAGLTCFSATTGEINYAKHISEQVREAGGRTAVGGAHASLFPKDCTAYFDHVVVGEGEKIITTLAANHDMERFNGIFYMERIRDLNTVPFPAWDLMERPWSNTLFPGERYGTGYMAATIIGSRGCPFKCAFCANVLRAPVIYRDPKDIAIEVAAFKSRGVSHFRMEDDNITLNKEWMTELCVYLGALDVHWKAHTRADLAFPEAMEKLARAGCEEMGLGIETADNAILKLVSKEITCKDCLQAVDNIKAAGMRAKTYFMAGLPGETDNTIEINKAFIAQAKPDKWTLARFTPYPGCDVWADPKKYGVRIMDHDFSHWWNFPAHSIHTVEGSTVEEMDERYRRFYQWLKYH